MARKHPHSRDFTPKGDGERYLLDAIPEGLWARVRRKAQREGTSLRALILRLLTEWVAPRDPRELPPHNKRKAP